MGINSQIPPSQKICDHLYYVIPSIGDAIIVLVDRKTRLPVKNKNFFIYPTERNIIHGALERKMYTTNKKGEIYFSGVIEQKIAICIDDSFHQFHHLSLRKENVIVTITGQEKLQKKRKKSHFT